jgi:heme/copper-type cytochrome/quinol oxidase subunit 2
MDDTFFSGTFLVTLAVTAAAWLTSVIRLVRLSRPDQGPFPNPLRRVLGIEIAWTLVPAAIVIALTVKVLLASRW